MEKKEQQSIIAALEQCSSATQEEKNLIKEAVRHCGTTSFSGESKILKTADVASLLGISLNTVRKLANKGLLKVHYGTGNKRWSGIMKDSVDAYLEDAKYHHFKNLDKSCEN